VFLRAVATGIIGYVVYAIFAVPGAGREFALAAIGCGLLTGVVVALARWLRRGHVSGLLEFVAGAIAMDLVIRGLGDLGRRILR
jgi:hypothetical protein